MKDTIVIPIFGDEYKVICTWGDWKKAAQKWDHYVRDGRDVLEGCHGVTLLSRGHHPLIILPRFPITPSEISTVAHEAVHAVEDIYVRMEAEMGGEIFAQSVGTVVRHVLTQRPTRKKKLDKPRG